MKKMIHYLLGTEMYIADDRVDEYLALGHRLACEKPAEPTPPPAPAKKTARSRKK